MKKKAMQHKKETPQPFSFAPPELSDEEIRRFSEGDNRKGIKTNTLKPGDEINVVVRSRIVEVGSEMCLVDMLELFQQNRIPAPLIIPLPIQEIRSTPGRPAPTIGGIGETKINGHSGTAPQTPVAAAPDPISQQNPPKS